MSTATEDRTAPAHLSRDGLRLLATAYSRAARGGRGRVGTEHLLAALLEDRDVAAAVLGPALCPDGAQRELARSDGDRWRNPDTADRAGAAAIVAEVEAGVGDALREAQRLGRVALPAGLRVTPLIFSGALVGAACRATRQAGPGRATAVHLAIALLHDPTSRAYEVLVRWHVDLAAARHDLAALRP